VGECSSARKPYRIEEQRDCRASKVKNKIRIVAAVGAMWLANRVTEPLFQCFVASAAAWGLAKRITKPITRLISLHR